MRVLCVVFINFCVALSANAKRNKSNWTDFYLPVVNRTSYEVISVIKGHNVTRNGKFWGIGVVKFENSECLALDGSTGTCYTRQQCHEINGMGSGRCAAHIGSCCVVQQTCGGSSSYNNTYFVNPNFPSTFTDPTSCSFTIKKCGPYICQVRIDFLNLNLAQPDGNGVCVIDTLKIVGGASAVPTICGENSGSHVYVDFNGEQDIRLLLQTGVLSSIPRNWRFKISQIDCECPVKAPIGCLQYYTSLTGTVKSFNYGQTVSSLINANGQAGSRQLANTNYGVCVAMQPGYCSITWAPTAGDPYTFTVSGNTINAMIDGTVGTPAAYLNGINCITDFVVIPNANVNGVSANTDRFCGNALPAVSTSSKPFVLTVVTNEEEINDAGNRGFSLTYTQQRCTTSMMMFFR